MTVRSRVFESLAVLLEITLLDRLAVAVVAPAVLECVFVQVIISVISLSTHGGRGGNMIGFGHW